MPVITLKDIEISCLQCVSTHKSVITEHDSGSTNIDNLFVLFYTTKPNRTDIGLILCRQIMCGHHEPLIYTLEPIAGI